MAAHPAGFDDEAHRLQPIDRYLIAFLRADGADEAAPLRCHAGAVAEQVDDLGVDDRHRGAGVEDEAEVARVGWPGDADVDEDDAPLRLKPRDDHASAPTASGSG